MSATPWRAAAFVVALSLAGAAAAQPPPPPPPPPPTAAAQPNVPAMPITAPQPAPQTEADKKLEEIRASDINEPDRVAMVAKLVQFIRENPDYPRLEFAYSTLLGYATGLRGDPAKVQAIADEALAKFPNPNSPVRARAIRAKFAAYRDAKDEAGASSLALKMLETETNPAMLEAAAQNDKMNGPKLMEKAIAERAKNADVAAAPTLDSLRWSYARVLGNAGRHDEGLTLLLQIVEETKKALADLDALPKDDPKQRQRGPLVSSRLRGYTDLAYMLSAAGQYQRALDYVELSEQADAGDPLEKVTRYESRRAGIYGKMGKPDLELESYVRLFSVRMEMATRDLIRDLSAKLGKRPEEAYARAREIRTKRATPLKGFELKTLEGPTATLDSLRAKVTLVNFFFPT